MFILILGLTIVAMVTFIIISSNTAPKPSGDFSVHGLCFVLAWVSGIAAVMTGFIICCLVPDVATASTIDDKITMYQEENARIEQDIDRIVEEYMKHEHDTFTDLKTEESSITLVALFPELKSDSLVQKQLEIYVMNNTQIKQLKEEKINLTKTNWLIYFGK